MNALVIGCFRNTHVVMVRAWMLWQTVRKGSQCCHGCGMSAQRKTPCLVVAVIQEASEDPDVLFVPRKPAPVGSSGNAVSAR